MRHHIYSKRTHVQTSHQEASFLVFRLAFQGMCKILQDFTKNDQLYYIRNLNAARYDFDYGSHLSMLGFQTQVEPAQH